MAENEKVCGCGHGNCHDVAQNRTPVQTEHGEVYVIGRIRDGKHLQEKVDNASRIEIDGNGKVVQFDTPMADKAEESYKLIVKPRKRSLWTRFWGFVVYYTPSNIVCRMIKNPTERKAPNPDDTERHLIKRS